MVTLRRPFGTEPASSVSLFLGSLIVFAVIKSRRGGGSGGHGGGVGIIIRLRMILSPRRAMINLCKSCALIIHVEPT